jgi:flagella basal body P-ring formation protein FlgA
MYRLGIIMAALVVQQMAWTPDVVQAGPRVEAIPASMTSSGPGVQPRNGVFDRGAHRELTSERIKKAIQHHLEGLWGHRVKEVQVVVLEPSEPVATPSGIVDLRVLPATNEEGLGRHTFQVVVTTNGKPWRTIEVLADVTATIDAVVPTRFFRAEEIFDATDLKTVRTRIYQLNHPFVTDREEVVGKSATRPLPAETPLRQAFLKMPFLVKKGDRVTIEAKRGGLSIHTYGVTKASGHVGQTVMVANLDSGRELRAKIVAPGIVQVEF